MLSLLPFPTSLQERRGQLRLKGRLKVWAPGHQAARLRPSLQWLGDFFGARPGQGVGLSLSLDAALAGRCGAEGYLLEIDKDGARLRAAQPEGVFLGCQTLRQLAQPGWEKSRQPQLILPFVSIEDRPKNSWRGLMLDCCRHFMPLPLILKLLDRMAAHKFNVFHWHLTEDQAWRIEIKRYPRLTAHGAWRMENGRRYGGFYSQADVRKVVAFAASRGITVVPEIEMPGHCRAALSAYPWLSCTGEAHAVPTGWGVFKDVYCPGKDRVIQFQKEVLDEVLKLFPSHWIHIGGDEVPKDRWKLHGLCQKRMRRHGLKDEKELQRWFLEQIAAHLRLRGRGMIGWDEIHEGGFPKGGVRVQWWINEHAARAAANEGHEVINTNWWQCYVDRGYHGLNTKDMYGYRAAPKGIPAGQRPLWIGGEAPLWTEGAWPQDVDQRYFPRALAFAEALWSETGDWDEFEARLGRHTARLKAMGMNYRDPGLRIGRTSLPKGKARRRVRLAIPKGSSGDLRLRLERLHGPAVKVERYDLYCGRTRVETNTWGGRCEFNVNFPTFDFRIPKPWAKKRWSLKVQLSKEEKDGSVTDAFLNPA